MIAEIRTYTVNGGMLDSYLELFNKQIVPNHRKYGIAVLGAWVDRRQNEVTWIRTFASREERKAKLDVYEASLERDAVFPVAAFHMAKAEVRVLDDALDASERPIQAVLETPLARQAYAQMAAMPAADRHSLTEHARAPR